MMRHIILIVISIIFYSNLYAQDPPVLNGRILYHAYSSYENWDGELFILDLNDNSVTNISAEWSVSHAINGMFSPDGKKIVFMADEDGWLQDWDIFLWTVGDEEPVNLTGPFSTDREEDPKFSPDGNTIVFKKNGDIMTMDLNGNILSNITNTPDIEESMPYYTADGSKILFAPGAGADSDIYSINTDGSNRQAEVAKANYQEYYPITRDSDSFFYTGWVSNSNVNDQVFLRSFSTGTSTYLPFNKTNANYSDATPVGLDYAVISSTRSGGEGGYDLYIADINNGNIWSLDVYNSDVNSSWEDLGAHYLPQQTLSVNNSSKEQLIRVSIFPNPVLQNEECEITISNSELNVDTRIEMYDLQGQILQSNLIKNLSNFKFKMNYVPGVYLVKIIQGSNVSVKKVIIN